MHHQKAGNPDDIGQRGRGSERIRPPRGAEGLWTRTELSKRQGYGHPGCGYSLWASWLRWAGVPGLEKARAHLEGGKDHWRADSSRAGARGHHCHCQPGQGEAQPEAGGGSYKHWFSQPLGKVVFAEGRSSAESKPLHISEEIGTPGPTIVPERKLRPNMGTERVATGREEAHAWFRPPQPTQRPGSSVPPHRAWFFLFSGRAGQGNME